MSATNKEIGEALAEARSQAKRSQAEASVWVGINKSAVSRIESGDRECSAQELGMFCELYGIDPAIVLQVPKRKMGYVFAVEVD
ncbi:MAG: helix-turn-helix domain-containing protein [Alphaproteobacteria bacterium]